MCGVLAAILRAILANPRRPPRENRPGACRPSERKIVISQEFPDPGRTPWDRAADRERRLHHGGAIVAVDTSSARATARTRVRPVNWTASKIDTGLPHHAPPIPAPLLLYDETGERRAVHYATLPGRSGSDRASRVLNLLVAAVGLVLTFPLMLVIALAVKLTSRGPVLYKQTRVGLDRRRSGNAGSLEQRRQSDTGGRLFTIYKFRTMTVSRERAEVWATPDDPRVTPVGGILRKYRLDELPQLWNVLKGDMNIVGPRPEQPGIFAELRGQIHRYDTRQQVLPGITGWAQVNHGYGQDLDDVRTKLNLDLEYLERKSAWEDFKIMIRTVPVMIFKKGAW